MKAGATTKKHKILQAMLSEVPFDGWTEAAYERALRSLGIKRGEADLLFPQGVRDIIDIFGQVSDDRMVTRIKNEFGFSRLRVRDKIALMVRLRLEALTPHREAVRRMLFWYAMPQHMPLGLKRLYEAVDLIWRLAGDTSTDFNFYTKRMLLAGVLNATTLFWLDDESANCEESWAFLDRRIAEVLKVGKSISLLKEWKPNEIASFIRSRLKRA